ncbi:MAG: hypothetical protein Q9177_004003 [Variospora cf. flavescens]
MLLRSLLPTFLLANGILALTMNVAERTRPLVRISEVGMTTMKTELEKMDGE